MNNQPTPETDAETMRDEYDHVDSDFGPFAPSDTVPADFARQLERERNEAREALDCLCAVVGLTPISGNKEALQEAVDKGLAVLRKMEAAK